MNLRKRPRLRVRKKKEHCNSTIKVEGFCSITKFSIVSISNRRSEMHTVTLTLSINLTAIGDESSRKLRVRRLSFVV